MKNTLKPITDFFDKEDKEIYESIQRGEWRPIDKKKAEKLKKEMVLAAKEAMDVKRKQQISSRSHLSLAKTTIKKTNKQT